MNTLYEMCNKFKGVKKPEIGVSFSVKFTEEEVRPHHVSRLYHSILETLPSSKDKTFMQEMHEIRWLLIGNCEDKDIVERFTKLVRSLSNGTNEFDDMV